MEGEEVLQTIEQLQHKYQGKHYGHWDAKSPCYIITYLQFITGTTHDGRGDF